MATRERNCVERGRMNLQSYRTRRPIWGCAIFLITSLSSCYSLAKSTFLDFFSIFSISRTDVTSSLFKSSAFLLRVSDFNFKVTTMLKINDDYDSMCIEHRLASTEKIIHGNHILFLENANLHKPFCQ